MIKPMEGVSHLNHHRQCSSVLCTTVIKTKTKSCLERKGLLTCLSPHLTVYRNQGKSNQEAGGSNRHRDHGGVLLTSLLSLACSASFVIAPRTTSPGVAPPTMFWDLPNNHQLREWTSGLPTVQSYCCCCCCFNLFIC